MITDYQIHAIQSGNLLVEIYSFSSCGTDLTLTCSNLIQTQGKLPSFSIIYSRNLALSVGLNRISENLVVKRGSIISITYNQNARVTIDYSSTSFYSDYIINGTTLTRLDPSLNARFFFNVLVKNSFYRDEIRIKKIYPLSLVYNLRIYVEDYSKVLSYTIQFSPGNKV